MSARIAPPLSIAIALLGCGGRGSLQAGDAGAPVTDLEVVGVLAPPQPNGATCVYVADLTQSMLSSGRVNAALASSYAPTLLVGNSAFTRIAIQGAQVRVVDPASGSTVRNETVLAAGSVEPGYGNVDSYTALQVGLLDASAVQHFAPATGQLPKRAVVHLSVYGTTETGESVQSPDFQFPVDVCSGCLVTIPATGGSSASYCSGGLPQLTSAQACVIGQDQTSDCQQCYSIASVCHGS